MGNYLHKSSSLGENATGNMSSKFGGNIKGIKAPQDGSFSFYIDGKRKPILKANRSLPLMSITLFILRGTHPS